MDNLERGGGCMEKLNEIVSAVDGFVWGPVMLVLLVGTGIFLTIRTGFLPWRNLGYALKSTLSKEARTKSRGTISIRTGTIRCLRLHFHRRENCMGILRLRLWMFC